MWNLFTFYAHSLQRSESRSIDAWAHLAEMTQSDHDSRVSEVSPHRRGNDWASEKGNDAVSQRADLFFCLCRCATLHRTTTEETSRSQLQDITSIYGRWRDWCWKTNKKSFEYFRKTFSFFSLWSLMNSGTKCQCDWRLSAHSEGRFVFVQYKYVQSLLVVSPRWNWIESQFYMCI